jgi:hypothetical protein
VKLSTDHNNEENSLNDGGQIVGDSDVVLLMDKDIVFSSDEPGNNDIFVRDRWVREEVKEQCRQ